MSEKSLLCWKMIFKRVVLETTNASSVNNSVKYFLTFSRQIFADLASNSLIHNVEKWLNILLDSWGVWTNIFKHCVSY